LDNEICEVCGERDGVFAMPSCLGALSYWCCDDCAAHHYEPYDLIVSGIACAGEWPDDITPEFQRFVRYNLKFHGKTEAEFVNDVTHCFDGMEERLKELAGGIDSCEDDRLCM
jgi:hypothetical protein